MQFALDDGHGGVLSNGTENPEAGMGRVSLDFSYLIYLGHNQWTLTSESTDWFLFGWNDSGGDDDRDDYMGLAHVSAVPLPAAFPLFGTGLGLLGLLGRRRKKRIAQAAI